MIAVIAVALTAIDFLAFFGVVVVAVLFFAASIPQGSSWSSSPPDRESNWRLLNDMQKLPYTEEARPPFGVCRKCSMAEGDYVRHAPPGPCPY